MVLPQFPSMLYQVLLGFKIIDMKLTYEEYDGSYSYDAFLKDVQEVFSLLLSLNL